MAAAITYDNTDAKYRIITDKKLWSGIKPGQNITLSSGNSLTLLQICDTLDKAKKLCAEKEQRLKSGEGTKSVESLKFNADGDVIGHETLDDTSSSDNSLTHQNPEEQPLKLVCGYGDMTDGFLVSDEIKDFVIRELNDYGEDLSRLQKRYERFKDFVTRMYGNDSDGRFTTARDIVYPRSLMGRYGAKYIPKRPIQRTGPVSYFDTEPLFQNEPTTRKRPNTDIERNPAKRARNEFDDGLDDGDDKDGDNAIGGIPGLKYSYMTRKQEERCYLEAGNNAALYAQKLAQILFAETIEKYFKDQNSRKRRWLHVAVDARFPTPDKAAQLLKWKNCSNMINKNKKNETRERTEESKARQGAAGLDFSAKYVTPEFEKECYNKSQKDFCRYAELMAFKLFNNTIDKFFKEQDNTKKDWLRDCIDKRFPCADKETRAQRWRVCAAACNKNRTKILTEDGKEKSFPYFTQEQEEECYNNAGGVASNYAEAIAKLLFPDTQHLLFKDQDIGKRVWLHNQLDSRFPSGNDKLAHVSKWKSCTSAINKNKIEDPIMTPTITTTNVPTPSVKKSESSKKAEPVVAPVVEKKPPNRTATIEKRMLHQQQESSKHVQEVVEKEKENKKQKEQREKAETAKEAEEEVEAAAVTTTRRRTLASEKELSRSTRSSSQPAPPSTSSSSQPIKHTTSMEKDKEKDKDQKRRIRPKFKTPGFTSYPYCDEDTEIEMWERSGDRKDSAALYARELSRLVFKDTLHLYFEEQPEAMRNWVRDCVDFRYPSKNVHELQVKWKKATEAFNKNVPSH